MKSIAIGAALAAATGAIGCGSDDNGPLSNVDSLIILQRVKRIDTGDIFQYTSYVPGARLVRLTPPTADGKLEVICCSQQAGMEKSDISGYDISFDAKQIVVSAKLSEGTRYGLFLLDVATGRVDQIPTDPGRDYVSPIFLPGDRIAYTTNSVVAGLDGEPTPRQHRDEYERGTTLQLGRINVDGSGEDLGPRNLSHRTFPTLTTDGRIMFTQWDHLGRENSGHLMFVNQDLQELREGFGKEGTGASNSTLKVREISEGRYVAIATARSRTIQSGALIDIRLGAVATKDGILTAADNQSEANATFRPLTPDVPRDNAPSADTVGRYYDAFPLNAKDKPDLVVSWADGPVESSVLAAANLAANFGVYLYNSTRQTRLPILDDPEMWDISARPLQTRSAPPIVGSASDPSLNGQMLIGSMNVYASTVKTFEKDSVFGVRIIEGYSSEEGFPEMFGTTMFEGQAQLAVARVAPRDGSWLASVPANVPLALQAVDKFGMSIQVEPVWFSGRKNESRVCGGCHEDRAKTTVINPGLTDAAAFGATLAKGLTPRSDRIMTAADLARTDLLQPNAQGGIDGMDRLVGMAWDKSIQPIFDSKCISCHEGTPGPANPTYTISTADGTASATWTFDLRSIKKPLIVGGMDLASEWPASYFSIAGPDMEAIEEGDLVVSGTFKVYAEPQNARGSILIDKINPTQVFPQPTATRFKPGQTPHSQGNYTELSTTEFYKLIMMADMGVNYYARENNPGDGSYE